MRELLDGKSRMCVSCSSKEKMGAIPKEVRTARAKKAANVARDVLQQKRQQDPLIVKFGEIAFTKIRRVGVSAKGRCTNPKNAAYNNYGGRGIKFLFPSPKAFSIWILNNLGACPSPQHSIDRVDNNRHYEPGNLRWASREEQARNKRMYKRSETGERVRKILSQRSDITYETVCAWIKQGVSDEEILQRRKYVSSSI